MEWFVGVGTALGAIACGIVSSYYFLQSICPPVTTTTGLGCVLHAAEMVPRGEYWVILAGVFALVASVSYPMKRFGGASFIRGRLFQPGTLEGVAPVGWRKWLFVPLLLAAYAALQLTEILLIPGGNAPYSDPKAFYIPAALDILSGERCTTAPLASTCNYEHPPLDKLFLALSIKVFGKNVVGYSLFPLLFGAGTLLMTYGIARAVSGERVGRWAAFFLLIDGTFLGLDQQAWTDVPMVFFGLAAVYVQFALLKDHPSLRETLVGVLLGLSILSKETGILFLFAIVLYSGGVTRELSLRRLALLVGVTALVSAAGLQIYDTVFTPFPTFVDHIKYILHYNSLIGTPGWPQESWLPFLGRSVVPLAWLVFYPPFGFISTMPEEWLLVLAMVVAFYLQGWRVGQLSLLEHRTTLFIIAWMAATYAPYFIAQLFRATYPFYMIQMLPAAAVADAWLMTKFTRGMKVGFVLGCLGWLYVFFPMSSTAIPILTNVAKWVTCVMGACPGGP